MMRIVKIESESNGFHDNRMGNISSVPDGWAVIPETMKLPSRFPFCNFEVDSTKTPPEVTKWTHRSASEPESPSEIETILLELAADHEERLCLIELGI